jgi:hypothetical protein
MNKPKFFVGIQLMTGVFYLSVHVAIAQTAAQIEAAKDILTKVPAVELASKSADLVANAPAKERAAVASAAAQVVASLNPDLASATVAAISLRVPIVAPAAAAAAAAKLPNSAGRIAVAAAQVPGVKVSDVRPAVIAAVPTQAGQVVAALSRANLSSSLNQEAGTSAVAAVLTANSNKTGSFRRVARHTP